MWERGAITLPLAIRRIGRVFVTTEEGSSKFKPDTSMRDYRINGGLGGCTAPLAAA